MLPQASKMSGSDRPGGRGKSTVFSKVQKKLGLGSSRRSRGSHSQFTTTPTTAPTTAPIRAPDTFFENLPKINVPNYGYRDTPGSSSTPTEATPTPTSTPSSGDASSPVQEDMPPDVVSFDTDIHPKEDHIEDHTAMTQRLHVFIWLGNLMPSNRVSRLVRNIMSRHMEMGGFNFKAISKERKEEYWQTYKKEVWWRQNECSEKRMKKLFLKRAGERFTDLMNYWENQIKGKNKKGEAKYPPWDANFVNALQKYWKLPEVVVKSEQNRMNRLSVPGGVGGSSTHKGGACGVTEWMYKKSGGKELLPGPWDSVVHLHGEPGSIKYAHMNQLCSDVAREYEERTQNPDPDQPPPNLSQIYVEKVGKKHGKMKGLGQVGKTMHVVSGVGGTSYGTSVGAYSQINYERVLEAVANMRKMQAEMEELQRKMEERERKMEEREKAREEAFQKMQQDYHQMQQRTSQQYWQSHMPFMPASTSSTAGPSGTFSPHPSGSFPPHPSGTFPLFPHAYGCPTSSVIPGVYVPETPASDPIEYLASNPDDFSLDDYSLGTTQRPPRSRRNNPRSRTQSPSPP